MEYISIILLLDKLLNNRDIIRYIIELKVIQERNDKREKQFNKTKDFFIENNFYNWLLHDIDLRYKINKSNTSQMSLYDIQLVKYYNKYFKALGICNYRRTLGLNKCFQLQWWKTTEKNHLEWRRIHDVIKSDICIMRLKEGNYDMENGIDYYHSNELLIKVYKKTDEARKNLMKSQIDAGLVAMFMGKLTDDEIKGLAGLLK